MATIKSQMVLDDGMTRTLNHVISALNTTLNAFEQIQRASGLAFDTDEFNQARAALAGAGVEVQEMADEYQKAAIQAEKLEHNVRGSNDALDGMLGKVKTVAATLGVGAGINKLIGLSDQMTSTTARLSFLVDDGGSVDELEAKIMASAQRSRAAYLDTASAIASMGANAGAAFSSNDELIAFMEQVNRQFTIGGASAQGQAAAMLQLTQAMAAGALRGEELNSILENAPGIARAIEQYMGIAEGSIKQYAQEGQVTAEVVKNALFSVADETNAKFESMPMTWAQIWTNMQNRALSALTPMLGKLNAIANSEQFDKVVSGALRAFGVIATVGAALLGVLFNVGSAIVDNWSVIEPIIMAAATALGIYYGVVLALNIAQAIQNGLKAQAAFQEKVHAAALAMSTGATFTATVAQYGLNAALLACPITWIIMLIIGVIALLYSVVAIINKVTGSAISATGLICGAIAVAGAAIGNIAIGVLNALIQYIWSHFAAPILGVAEWILNVCNGGFNSFGDAVANLIGQIIGWFLNLGKVVTTIIDAIFGTNWTAGLESLQNSVTAWGKNENAITLDKNAPAIDYRFGYKDAWAAGNDFGKGIDAKIGGMFDMGGLGDASSFDFGSTADNIRLTADNTGKTADALAVTEEQLEYLRDIAERDAINRFTTAEVKIDMTGMTNRIDGSADLDGVISQLTEGFTEALVTAAEGVHA